MQTKYPIVLVHGVAIKNIKFFKCFGQIDRILKIQGYHVYISNHDAFGSIATNAKQIKDFIPSRSNADFKKDFNVCLFSDLPP